MSQADSRPLPLVYSCSGASSIAQMANSIALYLDRHALAEMSCIAGVGGDVKALVSMADSGRPIVTLDGCPLHCVRACLARHGIEPTIEHTLTDYGVKKQRHCDFDPAEAEVVRERIVASLPGTKAGGAPASMGSPWTNPH